MNLSKKIWYLSAVVVFVIVGFVAQSSAQDRERVVKTISSRPINQPPKTGAAGNTELRAPLIESRPTTPRPPLTQDIKIAETGPEPSLVKKTASTNAIGSSIAAGSMVYSQASSSLMQKAIISRLGIPYLYGATGPNRYDCSGFVWAVFHDAGLDFTRESARSIWAMSEPVYGDDRFKFGTLVFLNGLGHMGIVADEKGFYHASSSKGITYSTFEGYWEKRIVGFRRLNLGTLSASSPTK